MKINLRSIFETCSVIEHERTFDYVSLCIDEELGELARAINRPARCDESAFNELVDVIICVCDMLWLIDKVKAVNIDARVKFYENMGSFVDCYKGIRGTYDPDGFDLDFDAYKFFLNDLLGYLHIFSKAEHEEQTKLMFNAVSAAKQSKWYMNTKKS